MKTGAILLLPLLLLRTIMHRRSKKGSPRPCTAPWRTLERKSEYVHALSWEHRAPERVLEGQRDAEFRRLQLGAVPSNAVLSPQTDKAGTAARLVRALRCLVLVICVRLTLHWPPLRRGPRCQGRVSGIMTAINVPSSGDSSSSVETFWCGPDACDGCSLSPPRPDLEPFAPLVAPRPSQNVTLTALPRRGHSGRARSSTSATTASSRRR